MVAGLAILVAGGTIVYSHSIAAPGPLALPGVGPAAAVSSPPVDGVWHVGPGSLVGWREVIVCAGIVVAPTRPLDKPHHHDIS